MKVRLLPLAAVAAVAMGAQGVAQQTQDNLERALADLNAGVNAPLPGSVDASQSSGLNFTGSARARNVWWNPAGMAGNQKAIDVRVLVNMGFEVTPNSQAFVSINGAEAFSTGAIAAGPLIMKGTEPGPGNPGGGFPGGADVGTLEQAWFQANDLIGDGGTAKIGRSYFTVGKGRLVGTDDWDQQPYAYSGIWYENAIDSFTFNVFMIDDVFLGQTDGGQGNGDRDLFGFSFNYTTPELPALGALNLSPYLLRMSDRDTTTAMTYKNWYGVILDGASSGFDFDGELLWARDNTLEVTDTAWALDVAVDLGTLVESLPGGVKPTLEFGMASAENPVAINPTYHDTAGIYDLLGRGGVWGGAADTWQAHLNLEPQPGWNGRFGYLHFNENNNTGIDGWEIDLSVGHELSGNVQAWLGWAMVDQNPNTAKDYIVYATLGLPF